MHRQVRCACGTEFVGLVLLRFADEIAGCLCEELGGRVPPAPQAILSGIGTMRAGVAWLLLSTAMAAQQYIFRGYQQPEGLRNLTVNGLAMDRAGFVWVATENGVYRFLGSNFERFGPQQGIGEFDIESIVCDGSGIIWAGTDENLYRWDGRRFSLAAESPIHVESPRMLAVEDDRHLLIVDQRRLYRLEHDQTGKVLAYRPVFSEPMVASMPDLGRLVSVSVVKDGPGRSSIWLGCGKRLCSLPSKSQDHPLEPGEGVLEVWGKEQGLREDAWMGVLLDRSGNLWTSGMAHVAVQPTGSTSFQDRNIPGSDPKSVYAHAPLFEDRLGRVLVPSDDGIARWEGDHWKLIGANNGLHRTSRISGIVQEAGGDLWLGSRGEGLFEWTGYEDWEGWSYEQGLPSPMVWAIVPLGGRVLTGTEGGPAWIDPATGQLRSNYSHRKWTSGQIVTMEVLHDGTVLAGTLSGGVLSIDKKTGQPKQLATLPGFVMSILEDKSGRTFISTKNGMFETVTGKIGAAMKPVPRADALMGASKRVESGCVDPSGGLWFLYKNQLLRLKEGVWALPPIDGLPKMPSLMLALSCAPDGSMWVTGDQNGTWRLTLSGDRLQASELHLPEELRGVAPLAILVDHRGWVWLGTDMGMVVWNGSSWRHLTQESGLIWNDVNQGILTEAPDGSLWIGTSGGLAHLIHPEHVFEAEGLTVSILGMRRGRELISKAGPITLGWSSQPLHFQISSPSMRNRSELVFKYRMQNLQQDWIDSADGEAVFPAVPGGFYVFEAMAYNPGTGSYSAPVRVELRIMAPWWRTWRFYSLCALFLVALLLGGIQLYARHLRARSRHLARLVGERTRELELSQKQLRIQATHDGLTGMLNRGAVLRALVNAMERSRRERRPLVVALVDLDHFKRVNDTYGHLAGDDGLRWFSAAVGTAIRPYDHAGRYGGEEFLLILTEIPLDAVESRLATLHGAISHLEVQGRGFSFLLDCSIGAAVYEPAVSAGNVELLLTMADQALYEAKARGRNCVVIRRGEDLKTVASVSSADIEPN
jgi:diguanylate cyclase (GGDEF)-like protein